LPPARALLVAVVLIVVAAAPPASAEPPAGPASSAPPASGLPPAECFLAKLNALRASKALAPVRVDADLTGFAQSWTDHMGATDALGHNPALADAPGDWSRAGENVGVGPDLDALFDAFVASPAHYANVVDPGFDLVGIGITLTGRGLVYTTEDFEVGRGVATEAAPAAAGAVPLAEAGASLAPGAIRCGYPPPPSAPLRIRFSLDQTRGVEPG
jgi:hypothetical protein